uniref:Uncharacterized protein n=1 Tax=viral metagenome TaxID=1070528 RepID=A0A6M3KB78_9ZZZZ
MEAEITRDRFLMDIFDNIRVRVKAWVERLTVGTDDLVEDYTAHIKGDRALVLQSRTDTYPEGNSRPILELRNVVKPDQGDGAGGVISWTSLNSAWVRKIAGWLNAGLIRNTAGSEDTCVDLGIHHKGQWRVFAIRADYDPPAVVPPEDKVWSLGTPQNRWKRLCGPVQCLRGPDGDHSIEFKWVYPPGNVKIYIDGFCVKTL